MRWLACLLLVACNADARPTLGVHVTDERGLALEGATVAAVCDARFTGNAGRTDAAGDVIVELYAAPEPCVVTISQPGFDPVQLRDVPACDAAATCDPIDVALVEVLP